MVKIILGVGVCGVLSFGGWGELLMMLCLFGLVMFFSGPLNHELTMMNFELDEFGYTLSLLSIWLISLALLSSGVLKKSGSLSGLFMLVVSSLLFFLLLTFSVSDLMMFYLMFESCLIPILIMILGWGYQPERSTAGVYMLFYTLFGSLPLFFFLLYLSKEFGSLNFMFKSGVNIEWVMFLMMVTGFLIKFPMYGVHLWLLKAHVEAPVAGSMILAGVLLKLGGYGMIRLLMFCPSMSYLKEVLISISLWGALITSFSCLRHSDMKLLIASSSVVHMSTCISGLIIMSWWGVKGCLVMMIAHGLCSSGLFSVANMVYERSHSRSLSVNKGLLNLMPSMSLMWFLLIMGNMAGPPSLNLMGEIMLLNSVISWSGLLIFFLFFLGFFSASYSIFLYSLSQHGSYSKSLSPYLSGSVVEFLILSAHIIPLNLLVVGFHYMC